ncbi:hypothetical protein SVAN01_05726 [Stagonosporopsis vannaccii]|nr:hypothetical protein SVAN01_05726 [Stagonosporopsis vannaccii]
MVEYCYIPPEYKTASRTASTPSDTTLAVKRMSCTAYRGAGIAGKPNFGQSPSFKHRPLPPTSLKNGNVTAREPLPPLPSGNGKVIDKKRLLFKLREEGIDDPTDRGVNDIQRVNDDKKKTGQMQKALKGFSKRFSATGLKI